MHYSRKILVVALSIWLVGCSLPTPYQPAIDGLGYAEQSIEADRYRITFSGNTQTPRATVDNYLLYRMAELTLEQGFDHFLIVEKDIERSTTYRSTGTSFGGYSGFYSYDPYRFGGFVSTTSRPRDRYAGFANVVMGEGAKPSHTPNAYDARDVLKRLEPTIARPKADLEITDENVGRLDSGSEQIDLAESVEYPPAELAD